MNLNDVTDEIEEQIRPFKDDGYHVTSVRVPTEYLSAILSDIAIEYDPQDVKVTLLGVDVVVDPDISGVVVESFEDVVR